jgi:hypothetical protein
MWNEGARWAAYSVLMFMTGVRSVLGYDDWPEMVGAGLLMLVFAVWAIGLYVYAWVRVIQRIRGRKWQRTSTQQILTFKSGSLWQP